ncbi:hypothetical protein HYX16_04195 [Candidatus Woesearchaeota archaeon]|nr:hypothetical protein [Candidatus Woesearchaeota archaeon]
MKKYQIIILIVLLSFSVIAQEVGIGISPVELKFENALKGTAVEKQLTMFNVGSKEITVQITADNLKDWLEFLPSDKISIPAKSSVIIKVKASIPKSTENREYTSTIIAKPFSENLSEEETNFGVSLVASSRVIITPIGEKIIKGEVSRITTKDVEQGVLPEIIIVFTNQGNIKVNPKIDVSVWKSGKEIKKINYNEDFVNIGENKEIKIKLENVMLPGEYVVNVQARLGKEIIEEKEVKLTVIDKGIEVKQESKKNSVALAILVIVLIMLIFLVAVAYFIFKK